MSRKLQHITTQGQRDDAERDGTKVATLCGARVYPMVKMKPEIPTCTPCSRKLQQAHSALLDRSPAIWTWTTTTGTTVHGFPTVAS